MKRTKPGVFRVLSLLLALLIVVNLPISAFAAEAEQESDISLLATTDVPDEMLNSYILKALLYLGYDSDGYLRNNGYLYQKSYISSKLKSNYPDALTGIPYANGGGTATTTSGGQTVPNVASFKANGMVCTSFIEYYYLNYLRYIAGTSDAEMLNLAKTIRNAYSEALSLCNSNPSVYPDAWSTTGDLLTTDAYGKVARKTTLEARYTESYTTAEYQAFFDNLRIGSLVQFGGDDYSNSTNDYVHYAVYAGKYNDEYYIIHVGNSRGPEISLARYMEQSDSKTSWPIAAYDFSPWEQYGSITVYKDDPDGKPLANAVFSLVNNDTGEDYTLITGNDGTAMVEDLLIDCEYTLTEEDAPPGYNIAEEHQWTFTLTAEKPTFSIAVTNTPKKGSLLISKNILPTSAATSGNLAGWQFQIFSNSPSYTTVIQDGVMYRVKVTDKNGNFMYSEVEELVVQEAEATAEAPIVITSQPANTALSSGSTASFTVAAKSSTGKTLTYQWYYMNPGATSWSESTASSSTTATYSLSMTTARDGRAAKCLISDGTNEIWSDPAYMYLTGSLGVETNPKNTSASYGATATFSATFYGTPTSYTWQYSTNGTTWVNCSNAPFTCTGYDTASLKVTAEQAINGYQFRCLVTDGSKTYETLPATLTTSPIYIFTSSPSAGALVDIGTTQSFYVGVAGSNYSVQWQIWTAESDQWTDLEGKTSPSLSLTMTEEYSNSRVRAIVTQGSTVLYSNTMTFATPDTFCITKQPVVAAGEAGEEVTLAVTANGEGLVYQWEMYDEATGEWISVDEQFGGTYTTGTQGTVQVNGIPIGEYYVVEIDTGREGWSYDLTPKAVTISEDNTAELPYEVTVTNELLQGSVYIDKYTEDDENYEGWKFGIYADADCTPENLIAENTTDEDGYRLFEGLPPGTYWVREEGHIDPTINDLYYCASENPQMVTVEAGKTATVRFENRLRTGTGKVVKITTNGGIKAGWQFHFWNDTADLGIYTTDENGEIVLDNLLPGTVYVQEVGHETYDLRYWVMDTEVKVLTIETDKTSSVSFENVWMGELVIDKQAINSDLLAGWTGDLYLVNPDGSETKIGTYTSNENGRFAELLVAPGKYIFRETGHSDSNLDLTYWVMAGDKEIVVTAGTTSSATITNTELGYGQIIKDTTNGGIKEGWQFNVWSESMETITVTTNANGEYDLGLLPPGAVYVQEIGHATMTAEQLAYWIMDSEVKTLVVEAGSTTSVQFNNQWLGMGRIKKEMPDGGSVAGWIFDVYRVSDNAYIGEFTSEENGDIALGYLIPGDYRVIERIPEGSLYQPVGGNEKILTVVAGETKTVTFRNVLRSGEIILNKLDTSNDKALAGAKFLLEWLDGDIWTPVVFSDTVIPGGCRSEGLENGCLVTGENGQITFEGLHPDLEYRLTEVEAPDGYSLQAAPVFEGKLPADTLSTEVTAYNSGIIVSPPTGVDAHFEQLILFSAIVVILFFAMVALAIKEGMLTEFIRKHRK